MENSPAPSAQTLPSLSPSALALAGLDLSGLKVRDFDRDADFPMVERWWNDRNPEPLHLALLPPLCVIVENSCGPVAFLACFESFGVGVAFLEFPVTVPGLSLKDARAALLFAVASVIQLAGTGAGAAGEYKMFRVSTLPGIARVLRRFGFQPDGPEGRLNLLYQWQ